jgi:hypothetical protein
VEPLGLLLTRGPNQLDDTEVQCDTRMWNLFAHAKSSFCDTRQDQQATAFGKQPIRNIYRYWIEWILVYT